MFPLLNIELFQQQLSAVES